jgi:hypothetical protein
MAEDKVDGQLLTALTTEQFVLQTARTGTIAEANGRAPICLGALSSGLIALGFTVGESGAFHAFAAVIIPALLVLGWFTFIRMVHTTAESVLYLTRIQRIRRWYGQLAPDGPWFADAGPPLAAGGSHVDEASSALTTTGLRPGWRQMLFTAAAMVAALNGIVLGAGIAVLLHGLGKPLAGAVVVGGVVGAATLVGQLTLQQRMLNRAVG